VTPASPAPVIVAAVVNRARREITAHFLAFHAISPGEAVAFAPASPIARRQFEKMRTAGVVREAGKDLYWLDVPAYHADIATRRAKLVPVVIIVSLLAAAVLLLLYRG